MKAISSIDHKDEISTSIPIMESFYTIQGEGFHTGKAAYFVRTSGCDVGCHWCDVKESWQVSESQKRTVKSIVEEVKSNAGEMVVITGGEPLIYDLDLLTISLRSQNLKTHLETSGAYPLSGTWDWICFSPKKFKKPLQEFYKESDELKVVIYNKSDFKWAEEHADQMNSSAKLYLQPEWSRAESVMPLIIDYVKHNPKWHISLQTHKYLNIP